ncbi:MAG: ornithine carbamoyltransferase [Nitrososphaeria archaeon]|jgi:ornithine carbamoyltransferase
MIKGKSLLSLMELDAKEVFEIIELSEKLKEKRKNGVYPPLLNNITLASIFMKPSTRTRISFNEAMYELGGHCIDLTSNELQLGRGETIEDTARVLSRYVEVIAARVFEHDDVMKLSQAATVPVINSLSDLYHPCQILADLQTIKEKKGRLQGLKLSYVGDGNNVCNTLFIGGALAGMNVYAACPPNFKPCKDAVEFAQKTAEKSKNKIAVLDDPKEVVKDADIVYTDTFVSMGSEKEMEERLKVFLPKYQVNRKLVRNAKDDFIFMHCLPAHRNQEVTDEVIDGENSVVLDEAENRLHVQKAIICLLLLQESAIKF